MLSTCQAVTFGVLGGLQLAIGIGLTICLDRYFKIVKDEDVDFIDLVRIVPLGIFWGMVVPFYLNGALGILAAVVKKVPACAVYMAFCIIGLLAGMVFGGFTIFMLIVANADDVFDCVSASISAVGSANASTDCLMAEASQLATAVAALHGIGWFVTLTGSIMGCVGTCCAQPDDPPPQGVGMVHMQPTTSVTYASGQPPVYTAAYATPPQPAQPSAPGLYPPVDNKVGVV